ncbi:hypothetical protein ACFX2I_026027 [Malus domestica]
MSARGVVRRPLQSSAPVSLPAPGSLVRRVCQHHELNITVIPLVITLVQALNPEGHMGQGGHQEEDGNSNISTAAPASRLRSGL